MLRLLLEISHPNIRITMRLSSNSMDYAEIKMPILSVTPTKYVGIADDIGIILLYYGVKNTLYKMVSEALLLCMKPILLRQSPLFPFLHTLC